MKTTFQHTLLVVLLITLLASVSFAQDSFQFQKPIYNKVGLHLGMSVAIDFPVAVIGNGQVYTPGDITSKEVLVLPGKLDLIAGYQINPYVSLDARVWTFWGVLWGVEFSPKINFTNTKVSPFISGSVGRAGSFSGDGLNYYIGTLGLDIHMSSRSTMYVSGRVVGPLNHPGVMIMPEIGYQFLF